MSDIPKASWERPRYVSDDLFDAFFQNDMTMLEKIESKFTREQIINGLNHQCNIMSTDKDNQPLHKDFLEFRNAWIGGNIIRKEK